MAQRMSAAHLAFPRTSTHPSLGELLEQQQRLSILSFPLVVKSRYSRRGDLVYRADGIEQLEQAIAAFTEAAGSADSDIVPLAVELLARTLPLCERDEESAWAWQHGLEHPDPAVAAAVRQRLRRQGQADGLKAAHVLIP